MTRCVLIALVSMVLCGAARSAPIKAMILDGQNNHDWKATTPVLKELLVATGRFSVDVATSPPQGEDMAGFNPAFDHYGVVILNYTGDPWNEQTRNAFVDYLRSGGGLVVVHAADNAFGDWKAYNEIIGFGGWGGRTKESGPYLYFQDGRLFHDHTSNGPAGAHEGYDRILIDNRLPDHPILKGMPDHWYQQDELYNYMRGPGTNMTILATSYSGKPADQGGSGRHEPMLVTLTYGKGRVFHTALGHDVRSIRDTGFALTFTRGAEWVATGRVSIPVPSGIPRPTMPHEAVATMNDQASYMAMNALLTELGALADDPQRLAEVEAVLVGYLEDPDTPFLGLQATCNALGIAGSNLAVPALARLLSQDMERASAARLALECIPGPQAAGALLTELAKESTPGRVGIINSLGRRREAGAVPALASLAASDHATVAAAAMDALGKIGNRDALAVLQALADSSGRTTALTACAYRLLEGGQAAAARPVFEMLLTQEGSATHHRTAALRGLLMVDPEQGMAHVWAMLDDGAASLVALNVLGSVPGNESLAMEILSRFDGLAPPTQITLLSILGGMGQPAALPQVLALAKGASDAAIREAAVATLGQLPGNSASMDVLCALALDPDRALQKQAHAALVGTPGTDAERLIINGMVRGDPVRRLEYMKVAAERRLEQACPTLIRLASDPDPDLQQGAYAALRTVAGPEHYEALIQLVPAASETARSAAVRAVVYAGRKVGDPDRRFAPIAAALESSNEPVRAALMPVLTDIGDAASLVVVTEYARSDSAILRDAAMENLGKWNHPAAVDSVLELAHSAKNAEQRAQWMNVFSRLMARMKDIPAETRMDHCRRALDMGLDIHGKRAMLAALSSVMDARAIELIEELGNEPELAEAARRAVPAIKQKLLGSPALTASHNAGELDRAIDNDSNSRWTTKESMKPDMWLGIDIRMQSEIHGITLDCSGSDGDYPRGYEVYITETRDEQSRPAATGHGTGPVTRIEFDTPIKGRFIKIVQTGAHGLYWSVHELTVAHDPGFESAPAPQTSLDVLLRGDGMITAWNVAGPFTQAGRDGNALFNIRFAPEMDTRQAVWRPLDPDVVRDGMIDLETLLGGDHRVAYLLAGIVADAPRPVTLALGSDDGIKAWLNGEPVHENMTTRPVAKDADKVSVQLREGDNTLLLKIVDVSGNWGACARIAPENAAEADRPQATGE